MPLLQRVPLVLFLQTHRNGVSTVVLVRICAGPHPVQPDRASKGSSGNLVLDTGNAIMAWYRAADVLPQLQVEASALHFFGVRLKRIIASIWSLDFLSQICAVVLLIVFGFWAGAMNGASLVWFVCCFGSEAVARSSIILSNRQLGDLSPVRSILLQGCSDMGGGRVVLLFLSLLMIQLDCESTSRLGD